MPNEYGIPTGNLFAYVKEENIPSAIFIGSTRINITYRGMEKRCRLCQSTEHAAGKCPDRPCFTCKTCGATTHTSRNCREDLLDSKNQFPELTKKTPKEGNETQECEDASVIVPEKTEDQPMAATTERTTTDDTISNPSDIPTIEDTVLTAPDEERIEEISIEDILQEVEAALPACREQIMDDAASTRTEIETPSTWTRK